MVEENGFDAFALSHLHTDARMRIEARIDEHVLYGECFYLVYEGHELSIAVRQGKPSSHERLAG